MALALLEAGAISCTEVDKTPVGGAGTVMLSDLRGGCEVTVGGGARGVDEFAAPAPAVVVAAV